MRYWMIGLTIALFIYPIHLGMRHEKLWVVLFFSVIQGFAFWFFAKENAPENVPNSYQIAFSQMTVATISFVGYVIGSAMA